MKGSGISSATATYPSPGSQPSRRRVALDGRSVALDPLRHAIRPDLADIRLAARVFAPHYAAPVARVIARAASLRIGREADARALATLAPGTRFDLLDVIGDDAWGIAALREPLVGYLDAAALGEPSTLP